MSEICQEPTPTEEEEEPEPEIAEDYGDARALLYTNQIITGSWFNDAEDYPTDQIDDQPWGRPETPTIEKEFTPTTSTEE